MKEKVQLKIKQIKQSYTQYTKRVVMPFINKYFKGGDLLKFILLSPGLILLGAAVLALFAPKFVIVVLSTLLFTFGILATYVAISFLKMKKRFDNSLKEFSKRNAGVILPLKSMLPKIIGAQFIVQAPNIGSTNNPQDFKNLQDNLDPQYLTDLLLSTSRGADLIEELEANGISTLGSEEDQAARESSEEIKNKKTEEKKSSGITVEKNLNQEDISAEEKLKTKARAMLKQELLDLGIPVDGASGKKIYLH